MQVAENDFGVIAEIVFRKSHFKLISRLPANGTSTLLARLEIEVLTFQVLPTGKKRRQRTKYLRQLNFEPAKNFKLNPFLAVNFCKSVSDFLDCKYDLPLAILFLIVLTAWSPGMRQFLRKTSLTCF